MRRDHAPHGHSAALITVNELARMLDQHAASLAPELLPNGHREGSFWRTSNVSDVYTGAFSLAVNLSGPRIGMWTDFGAAQGARDRSGDMLKLVACVRFGGDIGEACKWARSYLGLDGLDPGRLATRKAEVSRLQKDADEEAKREAEKMRRLALALYLDPAAVPVLGSPAEDYLANRGIDLSTLESGTFEGDKGKGLIRALKFHSEVWCAEANGPLPAMIAAVVDMAGNHIATHRTYLRYDGARGWLKADLAEAKKCLGSFWGGIIPLWKGEDEGEWSREPLHRSKGQAWAMSEGIEDGLTVACALPALRVVAAVTLGNMAAIEPPAPWPDADGPGPLTILGQRDKPGSQAARALEAAIAHHQAQGRAVSVALPPEGVKDFNDFARVTEAPA